MEIDQTQLTRFDDLNGKTAVVTGSSRGIGRAIALQFARAGADVLVHAARSHAEARRTADQVRGAGRRSLVLMRDLADPRQREQLVSDAWDWRGGVDIWVNNAGVDVLTGEAASAPFDEKLERLFRVDVMATIDLSRGIGARMREADSRGAPPSILNIGWDQAEHGMGGDSGEMFAAVKGAVMAFTRSLAHSLAPDVRVNCLAPGWIKTAWGEDAPPYWQCRGARESLLARWGTAEDVARVACFLVSPAASFINGQIVAVNGGFRHAADEPDDM